MKKVCLFGPESTGKTTLARRLARHYQTKWVPEFLRTYLDNKGSPCEITDMPTVVEGHWNSIERTIPLASRIVFVDTDAITSSIYHAFYYGDSPAWYESAIDRQRFDLYLLCYPDIPWIPDQHRDMPHRREELFALFLQALESRSLPLVKIQGDYDRRWQTSITAIDHLLLGL